MSKRLTCADIARGSVLLRIKISTGGKIVLSHKLADRGLDKVRKRFSFFYEDRQGNVVDEYAGPDPMNYLVDEETYAIETVSSYTQQYLSNMPPLKEARFQPVDRNSEDKIQERLDWVCKWNNTDMDFRKNRVFLHESAFHISMKRNMAWSKKGSPSKTSTAAGTSLASTGTVTGHYLSFLKATMDEMDKYPHMKIIIW
ncbi:hypothetical protein VTP01DRAFT_1264 [Rhizomucor pusillus]|uniref:uncharacterized protein n=1 Tax=Rhizomucor pusillus TaxID=4840 RepID=UPI0037421A89